MTADGETRDRRQIVGILEALNIPRLYWAATLDRIPDGAMYKARLRKYLAKWPTFKARGVGLFLTGPFGTGKTAGAVVVAKAVKADNPLTSVFFVRADELRRRTLERVEWEEGVSYEYQAEHVDLLVLDDIGAEHRGASGFAESLIENIVRARIQCGRPTILTTNLSSADLSEAYGPAFVSILSEKTVTVEVGGVDWRQRERDENEAIMEEADGH